MPSDDLFGDLQYPNDDEYKYEDEDTYEAMMDTDPVQTSNGTTLNPIPTAPAPRRYILSTNNSGKPPKTIKRAGTTGTSTPHQIPPARKFGSMPDVPVGTTFESREAASIIHPPRMAGIYADKEGAYSVVMSGGYVDDIDNGDIVTYTGAGGREAIVNQNTGKRSFSGVQTRDQVWERGNQGLYLNYKNNKPIRLIRGPWEKLKSPYAHASEYRYDGLYKVTDAYAAKGQEGFMMCRFRFERVPGQGLIPKLVDYDRRVRGLKRPGHTLKNQAKQSWENDSEKMDVEARESPEMRSEKRARLGLIDVPVNPVPQPSSSRVKVERLPPIPLKPVMPLPPRPTLNKEPPRQIVKVVPSASSTPSTFFPPRVSCYTGLKFTKVKREETQI